MSGSTFPATSAGSDEADATAEPRPADRAAHLTDYRGFFESSLEMLGIAGMDGWFKDVNQAFVDTLGYQNGELTSQPYVDLVHPDDRAATLAEAEKLATGALLISFTNRYLHNDGSYRLLTWTVTPDLERQLIYCAARDETVRREEQTIVENLLAELERSNTDLAQFAYVASHDLSEPLRMVSSYVQLLAERYSGQLDSDADEFIGFALDGTIRMKGLIDGLLAYSRAGGALHAKRQVDCQKLVRGALADLGAAIDDSGATVEVGDLPIVLGDPGQLAQVFQNLLSNALEFVEQGGAAAVRVSAERMGSSWCFSVQDNGIGIEPAHRERIFLMFKRLNARSAYPGTGIGLALCHKIVDRFGGRIWVEGSPGHGSTFRFTVPDPSTGQAAA